MWIRRALIDDFVEVEESCIGDSFIAEGLYSRSILRVVWHEPCCAERDGAWGGGDLGGRVLLNGLGELGWRDEVGIEGNGAAGGQIGEVRSVEAPSRESVEARESSS